jgi:hypothetical protein
VVGLPVHDEMMDTVGVPSHPLLVHAVPVLLSLAALAGVALTAPAGDPGSLSVREGKL